jgi:tryptophanyl-tRNA synthetase
MGTNPPEVRQAEPPREVLLSGIQPTGELHLGNYLGAIKNWVALLPEYRCFFAIVDLHAMTIAYDPDGMRARVFDAAVMNMACGLDPERCTLFVQSHVPEHTELAWILNTVTPLGELERMTQFKEKARQNDKNINAGLFTYPILQAADILLYKAKRVPVGEDQVQHLELCREIARRFNARFGPVFPEPQALLSSGARILGLDGKSKMSKSLGNHVALSDPPEVVRKKFAGAFTDPARLRRGDPGHPEVCNVFALHKFFTDLERVARIEAGCRAGTWGCVECKNLLAENVSAALKPIQERAAEIRARPERVREILAEGSRASRAVAAATMEEVRERTGLR